MSKASVFVTVSHYHPSLIFPVTNSRLSLDWTPISGFIWVGFRISCKYQTRVKVTYIDKRSSLLRHRINYDRRKFCNTGPWISSQIYFPIILVVALLSNLMKPRACHTKLFELVTNALALSNIPN
jgi:hypothetical protein